MSEFKPLECMNCINIEIVTLQYIQRGLRLRFAYSSDLFSLNSDVILCNVKGLPGAKQGHKRGRRPGIDGRIEVISLKGSKH